jgi:hypothetical protein
MPITIGDGNTDLPTYDGHLRQTMGAFTASLRGNIGALPNSVDGAIERDMEKFTAQFRESRDAFPRICAGRIGRKNWGQNPTHSGIDWDVDPGEQNAMIQCHFSVINPQHIHLDASRLAALEEWLDYIDANEIGTHYTYMYTDLTETGDSGSAEANKLTQETGPGGVLDWWVYENVNELPLVKAGTFGSSLHTNLTDQVTPDSEGKIWPEWYADNLVQDKLDLVNTGGQEPRIHVYNDVSDHRHRQDAMDYNANGVEDKGRSQWDTDGTEGKTQAEKLRQGHRIYFDRVRTNNHSTFSVICNFTTWSMEYQGTDLSQMFQGTGSGGIHSFYDNAVDGGWMEHLVTGPSLGGMDVTEGTGTGLRTVQSFGSWRLAQNAVNYLVAASTGRNHVLAHWGTWLQTGGDNNDPRVGGNITSSMMAQARWGIASTLLTDAYCFVDNVQTEHNMTQLFDEYGVVNTGTTGLSRGWLGNPIDASQLDLELASGGSSVWLGVDDNGIFKREFDNGMTLVNSKLALTGSISITIKVGADEANGELESGRWKLIDGLQDPAVNTGDVLTTLFGQIPGTLTIPSADGRVLERV